VDLAAVGSSSVRLVALAVTNALLDDVVVGLRADRGLIVDLGPDVVPDAGDEVLDAAGDVLLPGLVNGHTHAAMTLMRGYGGDLPLMTWLRDKIWPAEERLTDDAVYWGTRLACCEMIRTGTVRFWDMYWRPVAVARAVLDAGLKATVGHPLIDGLDASRSPTLQRVATDILDELEDLGGGVSASLTPHGIYTLGETSLAWVAETAAARDLPIQLHFLEVADEASGLWERTGEQPAAYLDRLGVLGPRTVLAHCVWAEDGDLELIASRGATVVTNPASNLKLAVGRIFPYEAARRRGIPVGLGTDGASSNNGLDILQDVKLLALLQKHAHDDPSVLPASEAWAVGVGALAPSLGTVGTLAPGHPADFILVSRRAAELGPGHLMANLVYAASGAVVDTTVVAGRVLMRHRELPGEDEVLAKAREAAVALGVLP
jgi:5-methylthioadenosine/S-adenosylhomocysteine deaminase